MIAVQTLLFVFLIPCSILAVIYPLIDKWIHNPPKEIIEIEYTDINVDDSYYNDSNFETIFGKGE